MSCESRKKLIYIAKGTQEDIRRPASWKESVIGAELPQNGASKEENGKLTVFTPAKYYAKYYTKYQINIADAEAACLLTR